MKKIIFLILILSSFSSWAWKKNGVHYLIPQNSHDAKNLKGGFFVNNKLIMDVRFDETARYQTQDPNNQSDINKLFGFSDCWSVHHKNSARIGWRWRNEQLELVSYVYIHGERKPAKLISVVNFNQTNRLSIKVQGNKYIFQINNETLIEENRGCDTKKAVGYRLYPYFGGNEVASHKIDIFLQRRY